MTSILEIGTAVGKIILDTSGVDKPLGQVSKSLGEFFNGGQKGSIGLGEAFTMAGANFTLAFAPITTYFKNATDATFKFHESMSNIAAVLNLNDDAAKKLSDQILAFSKNTRAGPQEVAEAFYDIAGGVADARLHMTMLQEAVKLSEAGNSSLAGTTNALIAIMNGYGFSAKEAGYASDVLTRTVGMGVGTMDQFAAAMPNVTGLAHSAGISFGDLGGMMAYLTTKGNSASESATQLSSMMIALMKPNDSMKEALQKLGFASGDAALKTLGLAGTYKALLKAGYGSDMAALTGKVEALRGVTALTGSDTDAFFKQFKDGMEGATDAARAIQLKDPAAQFDILKSSVEALSIKVGEKLVPVLSEVFKNVKPIIDGIIDWIDKNPELAGQIAMVGGALAIIGPILMGVGTLITGVTAAFALLTSPIFLAGAALAYLFGLWNSDWMGVKTTTEQLFFIIGLKLHEIFDKGGTLDQALTVAKFYWDSLWNSLGTVVNQLWFIIINGLNSIFGQGGILYQAGVIVVNFFNGIATTANQILAILGFMWGQFFGPGGTLEKIILGIAGFFAGIFGKYGAIAVAWDNVFGPTGALAKVWDSLFNEKSGTLGPIVKGLSDFISTAIGAAITTVQGIIDKINAAIEAIKTFLGLNSQANAPLPPGQVGGTLNPDDQIVPILRPDGSIAGYEVLDKQGLHQGWQTSNHTPTPIRPHDYYGAYNSGQAYLVGTGAQPELFAPGKGGDGTAIPNFDKVLQSLMGGAGKGGGDGVVFEAGSVVVYANDRRGGEEAGDAFEKRMREKLRKRG